MPKEQTPEKTSLSAVFWSDLLRVQVMRRQLGVRNQQEVFRRALNALEREIKSKTVKVA